MSAVIIRVGAAADRSLGTVFQSLQDASTKAKAKVESEMARLVASQQREYAKIASQAEAAAKRKETAELRAVNEVIKATEREARAADKASQAKVRADQRAFEEKLRLSKRASDEFEKQILKDVAAAERAEARMASASRRSNEQRALGVGRSALGTFGGMVRGAAGIGMQIARGAGVDLDIGAQIAGAMDLQRRASVLSNSAFQSGASGAAGQRQDPAHLIGEARSIANATAFAPSAILGGAEAFTKKTGDLETARTVMKDLAVLSKATGTELEDMVSAAGDVALALGDTDHKGEKIKAVMTAIAGQGKLGAVEISDLASQMAKVAANAPQFAGSVQDNIIAFGAMAQLARQRGGASTAVSAAQSVLGFANTLKTPARVSEFKAQGIDVYDSKGMMRDPFAIIRSAIEKSGSDPLGFKKMFGNVSGARGAEALAGIYRQAGGGSAGMAAVDAEIAKLKGAAMGEGEIMASFSARMKDGDSKVQILNNKIGETAERLSGRLLPHFDRFAELAEKSIGFFGGIAEFAAINPGEAIVGAIVISIGKAAIGDMVGRALGDMLKGAASGAGGIAGMGGIGAAGLALTIAAATIIIADATIQHGRAKGAEGQREAESSTDYLIKRAQAQLAEKGVLDPETKAAIVDAQQKVADSIKAGETYDPNKSRGMGYLESFMSMVTGGKFGSTSEQRGAAAASSQDMSSMQLQARDLARLAATNDAVAAKLGGTLNVNIVGGMPGLGPGIDDSGRTGSSDGMMSSENGG